MTATLDAGTYEVLRTRLADHAKELASRAEQLNQRRIETFGGSELTLVGTERIRTEHNCVPRDIVPLGGDRNLMLLGYNVFIGLKPETTVADVFAVHEFRRTEDPAAEPPMSSAVADAPAGASALTFEPASTDVLHDEQFERDFAELYRYYRDTRLMQLRRTDRSLLAVFQTGPNITDTRVLRWRVGKDGALGYANNRGERENVTPPAHDFEWIETTREHHVAGRHPHISIEDVVFVDTLGGDLTISVENNTETGEGIYAEPVDEPLQSLADADVHYARVGTLILLRIRPYNEPAWRYLVFNTRTHDVARLDGIGLACQRLPEDHGIIFPGGYYLATGTARTFDTDVSDLEFARVVRSPNGEDVLYVFYARAEGRSLLLPYNVIRKQVDTPISCHGYSLFEDGTLVVFRATSDEPTRVHPMQVWQSPYMSDSYAASQPTGTGALERIGNSDLVRGISDCLSVTRMVEEMAPSAAVFDGIIAACRRVADQYHWLDDAELLSLGEPLREVRSAGEQVQGELETVEALTAQARTALDETEADIASLVRRARGEAPRVASAWVNQLAELHRAQGHLVTLREMRYSDADRLDEIATTLDADVDAAAARAVTFLQRDDAFTDYHDEVERLARDAAAIRTVAEAADIDGKLAGQAEALGIVTEVVGALDIADATVRTAILGRISEVLAGVNRARATLGARRRELLEAEGHAAFAAEFALLGQAVSSGLALAATPETCDEQLGRLLLTLENLEARFGELDDFAVQLEAKREDVYEAFSARKQALLDDRTRRAGRLADSADRILRSVRRRISSLESLDEVNTYFGSDPMVVKLRSLADELRALGDQVRAEELDGRVKAARQEAGRALRDQLDLYDGDTIRLGRQRFVVHTEPVELTMAPSGGAMSFTLTGTDYRSPVRDEAFTATRPFWDQLLVSESAEVYRGEYLASAILDAAAGGRDGLTLDALHEAAVSDGGLLDVVREIASARYDEGYERGVHDEDAAAILETLLRLHAGAGVLRYPSDVRAAVQLYWAFGAGADVRASWSARAGSLARARTAFGQAAGVTELCAEAGEAVFAFLRERLGESAVATTTADSPRVAEHLAGEYLFEELGAAPDGFVTGAAAKKLLTRFRRKLGGARSASRRALDADLHALSGDLAARHQLVTAWLTSYAAARTPSAGAAEPRMAWEETDAPAAGFDASVTAHHISGSAAGDSVGPVAHGDLSEAVAIELCGTELTRYDSSAELDATVDGLLGTHPRISGRAMAVRLDETLARTRRFRVEHVPAYRDYQKHRNALVVAERARLRLEEFQPAVFAGFVRNQLLDQVYLPLIGDNLAKQLGTAGDSKRTDLSGLLLLISPPGYGKTTLMEYVANRLGLVFVKVNGPALGHGVTSLDPAEAPNATARQEVEKISFALEMGNNVLLYLDDIQHTSPELLQKFISLCDAQRRMEGVWDGRTRTYDLRGKRFAVCMAGNPYTAAGRRFRVPDMLANRADVWNLGDVLSGRDELFALSYVENALTSNSVLAPLAARPVADLRLLLRLARGDGSVRPDQLEHSYPPAELDQVVSVLAKLARAQQIVLAVNQAYIASAAQADASRTEPPFLLQGSYRNMNRLAERIVPVMNDDELAALIDDHYAGEAQTLTSGAEANLLKLAELRGRLRPEQAERWDEVKAAYLREKALGGAGDDPLSRAVGAVGLLADKVGAVEAAIRSK